MYTIKDLVEAASSGNLEVVKQIIESKDIKVDETDKNGLTALMAAVNVPTVNGTIPEKNFLVVRYLVEKAKASIQLMNNASLSATVYASRRGHMTTLRYFFEQLQPPPEAETAPHNININKLINAILKAKLRFEKFLKSPDNKEHHRGKSKSVKWRGKRFEDLDLETHYQYSKVKDLYNLLKDDSKSETEKLRGIHSFMKNDVKNSKGKRKFHAFSNYIRDQIFGHDCFNQTPEAYFLNFFSPNPPVTQGAALQKATLKNRSDPDCIKSLGEKIHLRLQNLNTLASKQLEKLINAARKNNHTEVKRLIETKEVKANAKDKFGLTALVTAAKAGALDVVKYLVSIVSVNASDKHKMTGLMAALNVSAPLPAGNFRVVRYLVKQAHANINAGDEEGYTALMYAAEMGHQNAVTFLVAEGHAKISAKSQYGKTAKDLAQMRDHKAIEKYLKNPPKSQLSSASHATLYVPAKPVSQQPQTVKEHKTPKPEP